VNDPDELKISDDFVRRIHEAQQKNKPKYELVTKAEQIKVKEKNTEVKGEAKEDQKDQGTKQNEAVDIDKGQAKYIHKALKKAYRKKENTKTHKNKPKEKISYE